jgi:outer membrane protein OmpA-like peptidoglycan-associated protein
MTDQLRRLLPLWYFLVWTMFVSGCAGPKSYVVLLPKDGQVSGEVTVTNAKGTQVLNRSWQKTEIAGANARPSAPVQLDEKQAKADFSKVLATLPSPPVHFLLFFHLDSTDLMPASRLVLPEIVKSVQQHHPARLSVVGHTDTVASEAYNYQLGRLRAQVVLALLRSMGADPILMDVVSKGKNEPLVRTPDETLEPRNRRAEVVVW